MGSLLLTILAANAVSTGMLTILFPTRLLPQADDDVDPLINQMHFPKELIPYIFNFSYIPNLKPPRSLLNNFAPYLGCVPDLLASPFTTLP